MAWRLQPSVAALAVWLGSRGRAEAVDWYVASGPCEQDASGCIASPNFQMGASADYGTEACTIQIGDSFTGADAIAFDTESIWDRLVVDARSYSGTNRPRLPLPPGTMTWTSDDSNAATGFKLCANDLMAPMWRVTSGACKLDQDTGCITTPGFPLDYDNAQRCVIDIPAGFGGATVASFDLSDDDPLILPGGEQLYGGVPDTIYPPPNSKIYWAPDPQDNTGGWKFCPSKKGPYMGPAMSPGAMESMPASVVVVQDQSWLSGAVQGAARLDSIPEGATQTLAALGGQQRTRQSLLAALGGAGTALSIIAVATLTWGRQVG